jgi:PBSX family phage terminase large subunit
VELAPLQGKQREAVRLCTSRINIFEGSVRSAKTVSSLLAWLKFVRTAPPGNLLMAAKTGDTLKRNVIDLLTEMLGPARCVFNIGTRELLLLGRKVYVGSANDERSAAKLAGLTLLGAYCDELSTWPESYFRMLGTRLSEPSARLYGTTNPDSPMCWLKTGYLDRAKVHLTRDGQVLVSDDPDALDLARLSFVLADNPHLSPEYVKALSAEYTGLWRKRYVEGLWVIAEGAIYDMFDVDKHVVDVCPVIKRWICCSIDYGTTNPFDAILIGVGIDRRLYAVAEWRWDSSARRRQLTDLEYSVKLREWLASVRFPGSMLHGVTPERIVVDPSAASFRVQLFQDRMQPVLADNEVLDGIRLVSSLLSSGRLLIHKSCTNLIDEMQSYCWDEKAAAKGQDAPVKVNDHSADSLRYGIATTRSVWRNLIVPAEAPPNYEETFGVAL